MTQALIVRTGHELYALPLPTVEGIIRISRTEFEERMARPEPAIEYGGQRYFFRHLGQFLGVGPSRLPEEQDRVSIILVRAGENSTALITDEMPTAGDRREARWRPTCHDSRHIRCHHSRRRRYGDSRRGRLVRSSRPAPDMPAPVPSQQKQTVALVWTIRSPCAA